MNRISYIYILFLVFQTFCSVSRADCLNEADFRTWITEGNTGYGNWQPTADGKSVTQMSDTMPSFFVNNQELINVKVTGEMSVESSTGDDFIGIVFGYKQPSSVTQGSNYNFWLISWKKTYENYQDNIAQEGISLAKVEGTLEDSSGAYYNTFWEQKDTPFFQILATKWNLNNGWKNQRKYKFQLIYTTTKIVFILDKDTIFNEGGCFEQGRFGLFSFKQKNVKFSNVVYELAADFNPIPPQACKGESILFRATCSIIPTNIVSWEWDFGDGNSSTEVNPEYTYKNSGSYDVILKITDETGCTTKTTINVKVHELPVPVITGKTITCSGSLDTYEGSSDPDVKNIWQISGNGEISGASEDWNCRVKWGNAGSGRILLLQTNKKTGCKGQTSINVEINNAPKITAGKDGVLCRNEPYQLFCEATGGSGGPENYKYDWSPPDGLDDPYSKTPVLRLAEPGFYVYEARVTDSLGCTASTVVRLTVREYPVVASIPDSLNFGVLLGCNNYIDTLVKVTNKSKYGIKINKIYPANIFNLAGIAPNNINPGDSAMVRIRFEPTSDGIFSDSLSLVYEPCGDSLRIAFYGEKHGISFSVPDTIDIGELIYCRDSMKTLNYEITNTSGGSTDAEISSVTTTGPFVTSLKAGDSLVNGKPFQFTLTFAPGAQQDGIVDGEMVLHFDRCNYVKTIYLKAIKSDVSLYSPNPADFGLTDYNSRPVQYIYFINDGSTAVVIKEVISSLPATFSIESLSQSIPSELKAGDSLTVGIKYKPGNGSESAQITAITEQPCFFEGVGFASGISNLEPASVTITAPVLNENAGAIFRIPLTITQSKFMWENDVRSYEIFLRFNKTMLLPFGNTPTGTETGKDRIIVIEGSFATAQEIQGIIAEPEFIAVLGNDSCTVIYIDSIRWNNSNVRGTYQNGSFCLRDLCKKGNSPRYYIEGPGFGIVNIAPNPAQDIITIEYIVNESTPIEIQIYDLPGRLVANRIIDPANKTGMADIDIRDLHQGIYILQLRTLTQQKSELIEIIK